MVKPEGLARRQWYNEHMGCIMGCLDYLGIDVTPGWLYGGTGHAFVINMNDTVFVDCPQAWSVAAHFGLYANLGFCRDCLLYDPGVDSDAAPERFADAQRQAWDMARAHMDNGLPCYAWELSHVPSYHLVTGYDDVGYYYSAHVNGGPCPWDSLGTFDVRYVALHAISPLQPVSDSVVVRDALNLVLARVDRRDGWTIADRYVSGLAAYEMWAASLAEGRATRRGGAYVNCCWLECRQRAVEFLREARQRLNALGSLTANCDRALRDAAWHYAQVASALAQLLALFPEPEDGDWFEPHQTDAGAALVRQAGRAEKEGVQSLKKIAEALR